MPEETLMFMGYHVGRLCSFPSHFLLARQYPCLAPKDIGQNTMYINALLPHNKSAQIQQLTTNAYLLSHSFCEKSGRDIAGFSAPGSHRLKIRC